MHRDEAIVQLRMIVDEERNMRATQLANTVHALTGLYPHDWQPHKDGIRWQGFYLHEVYLEAYEPTLVADVLETYHVSPRLWANTITRTRRAHRSVGNARGLLALLEDYQPYVD